MVIPAVTHCHIHILTQTANKRTTVNSKTTHSCPLMPAKKISKPSPSNPVLDQLLEAHVAHELAHFSEASFPAWLDKEITLIIKQAKTTRVSDWVNAQMIKDLIQEHVVRAAIPGAFADISGQMSDKIFTSDFHQKTRLKQILSRSQFEEFVDKALELKEQRNNGLDKLIDLPIYTDLISGILFQSIIHYIYDNNLLSKNIPGMSSLLKASKSFMHKAAPKLGNGIEDSVRNYIANSLELIIIESKAFLSESVTDSDLKESAMELWSRIENKPLSEFQRGMNSLDLSEFIALGYQFWLSFRKSDYFRQCYEHSVDFFFEQYAAFTLEELMEEFQVTPTKISTEVQRFGPALIAGLRSCGYLEKAIRRHLEGFYHSSVATECLSDT